MNLQELEEDLDERSLSITIHPAGTGWVVWLFPADDPAQMIIEEGSDLVKMIAAALKKWDGDGGLGTASLKSFDDMEAMEARDPYERVVSASLDANAVLRSTSGRKKRSTTRTDEEPFALPEDAPPGWAEP